MDDTVGSMTDSLGQMVMEAIKMRDQLKADGMTGPALDAGLETVVRDIWPKPKDRTEPWHDGCATCRDYGLEMRWCPGDGSCGSHPVTQRPRKPHAPHEYGKPCWCVAGRRHQEKVAPSAEDAETMAAKRKPMSRWGR